MSEKSKKLLLWTSLTIAIGGCAGLATAFVVLQQKNKEKESSQVDTIQKEKLNDKTNKLSIKKSQQQKDLKNKENELEQNDHKEDSYIEPQEKKNINWNDVFPNIKSSDYYDKLNYRNGQAWIDEDMIVYIIKDIINRMLVTEGEVEYAYKQIDDQNLLITFKWSSEKEKSVVTYKINTNKL
ncbi:MHO_1590 family protein [Mycoplasma sp. 332]|uniref:MHO_1590 family protein n=1 Tax=unclassified Asterococcus (in: mycoplasmas, genus) TaxID=3407551 RepID=UPI003F655FE8